MFCSASASLALTRTHMYTSLFYVFTSTSALRLYVQSRVFLFRSVYFVVHVYRQGLECCKESWPSSLKSYECECWNSKPYNASRLMYATLCTCTAFSFAVLGVSGLV